MSEIINLENTPQIGFMRAIKEGFVALIKNWKPFLKMFVPTALLFLATLSIFLLSIFYNFYKTPFMTTVYMPLYGLCLFFALYFLLEFFMGLVAISYLAKDIYENKPIQKPSVYFDYVKFHIKSYMKFCFFIFFIYIIFLAIYIDTLKEISLPNITATALFCILLMVIAVIFWAYQDKAKPVKCLLNVVMTIVKSPKLWFLIAVLYVIFFFINCLAIILHYIPLPWFLNILLGCLILCNAISFIFTRVYFEIKGAIN